MYRDCTTITIFNCGTDLFHEHSLCVHEGKKNVGTWPMRQQFIWVLWIIGTTRLEHISTMQAVILNSVSLRLLVNTGSYLLSINVLVYEHKNAYKNYKNTSLEPEILKLMLFVDKSCQMVCWPWVTIELQYE